MDKVDRQRAHFNNISEKYFDARQSKNHLLLKDLIWLNFLSDKKHLFPAKVKALEPMCGSAEGYGILEKNLGIDIDYVGFDYSENMVAIAQELLPEAKIYWGDATKFNDPDGEYDLIILIGGLHHVYNDAEMVVSKLARSLKSGGVFINFEPTHNSAITKFIRERVYKKNNFFDDQTERGFDLVELNNIYLKSGLAIRDQVYAGMLSYILFYNPDAFPFLNVGGSSLVKFTFAIDRMLWRSKFSEKLSFASITLCQKM